MRYPYERFLRFLISRKADVNLALGRIGLPEVGGLWAPSCRTSLRESAPPPIVQHLAADDANLIAREGVLEWAETEGFRELWEAQAEFKGEMSRDLDVSLRIFSGQRARTRMGLFLFSKSTPSEISEVASEHFDMEIQPSTIELYRRIFWDTSVMTRSSWERLIDSLLTKEERHYLAQGLESPTLDGVKCVLGIKYALEPDAVLRRLMVTAIEQYDSAIKQPIPSSDALRWGEMAKGAAIALAQHVPKKAAETGIPTDFGGLFTVQISKSNHISLADLQGQVGTPEPSKPPEEP